MTIGGFDYGKRSSDNVQDERQNWFSLGVSTDGAFTLKDFSHNQQDLVFVFNRLSESNKNTLKSYLQDTVLPGGVLTITPDAGDDLQCGATGATAFTYIRYRAIRLSVNLWRFEIYTRKYS